MNNDLLPLSVRNEIERTGVGEVAPGALRELSIGAVGGHARLVVRLARVAEMHGHVAFGGVSDEAGRVGPIRGYGFAFVAHARDRVDCVGH